MKIKFDYHIFGLVPENMDISENMKNKIIEGLRVYLQERTEIFSYYMDNLIKAYYKTEELIDAVKKTMQQIDKGIYCVAYNDDVLFVLWNGTVKDILWVKYFKGMIVEENMISIFSSSMESYGTAYGRINLDRKNLKYFVEKCDFHPDCRLDWKDDKIY